MPQAIVFDVDGTLVDSVDLHAHAWQDAFAEFGKDIPFQDIRDQIGKGGDQLMPVFLSEEEVRRMGKELQKTRSTIYKEKYLSQVRPFPGVRELFERIKRDGKKIALASSAEKDEFEPNLRLLKVDDLVDAATSSADAERSKPHPDIFEAALKKLGLPAPACIAVGDTPYDAQAAGKIGLATIGLLCGGFPEQDLRSAGCLEIRNDPADLLSHYDESALR